jgi:hypothetical protein
MIDSLSEIIEAASIHQSKQCGNYYSRWGKVWRDKKIIAFIDSQYLIPTIEASPEEISSMDEYLTSRNKTTQPGEPLLKLKLKGPAKGKVESSDYEDLKNKYCNVSTVSLVETGAFKSYNMQVLTTLSIQINENPSQVLWSDHKKYNSTHFVVNLLNKQGSEVVSELFDYNVCCKSSVPPVEVVTKSIREELESINPSLVLDSISLGKLAFVIYRSMDAAFRFLSKEPLPECRSTHILSAINEALQQR